MRENYETSAAPLVTINRCGGKLIIRSGEDQQVQLRGDDCQAEEKEKGLQIESGADLYVRAPAAAQIVIRNAGGDLIIKGISGHVLIDEAAGDVVLSHVGAVDITQSHGDIAARSLGGPLQLGDVSGDVALRRGASLIASRIHGDLSVRLASGDVTVDTIDGDATLAQIDGSVVIQTARADVTLKQIAGVCQMPEVLGTARLYGSLGTGKHTLKTAGGIVVNWPVDVPVRIVASGSVKNRLPLTVETETKDSLNGYLGAADASTTLVLESRGRIVLKESDIVNKSWVNAELDDSGFSFDFDLSGLEGLGDQIRSTIDNQMRVLEKQLGSDLAAKIEKKLDRAARRAEVAVEQAAQKAERAAARQSRRSRGATRAAASTAETKREKKAQTAEQLHVLKMLEQGIITAEEATTLLEALE